MIDLFQHLFISSSELEFDFFFVSYFCQTARILYNKYNNFFLILAKFPLMLKTSKIIQSNIYTKLFQQGWICKCYLKANHGIKCSEGIILNVLFFVQNT